MAVEVKQLVVKGTVMEERESPQEPVPVPHADAVDEECIQAESRRIWREAQRQRDER